MIGTGGMAGAHVERLRRTAEGLFEIVALCDVSDAALERFTTRLNLQNVKQYRDYEDMIAKESLDGVIICSPHTSHFGQVMYSLDHGLHVLVEKPLACSADECRQISAKAEATGKVAQVGYQRHYIPQFLRMKELISNGEIGNLHSISCTQGQNWKRGTTGSWRQDPALSGGGQLHDSGSHLMDALLWLTGLTPVEVFASVDNRGTPVDINSVLLIRFAEGAQAVVNVIGDSPYPQMFEDITIVGTNGSLRYRSENYSDATLTISIGGGPVETFDAASVTYPASNPDLNFVETIQGKASSVVPPVHGLRVMILTESAWQSGKENRVVTIPLVPLA